MIERATPAVPPTFVGRRRAMRTAAAVTSSGLLASIGVAGAAPALAATPSECNAGNTVDASTGDAGDIQTLLTAETAIVCLSGTFPITSTLTFGHDLTLFGLSSARLDGGGTTQLLAGGAGDDLLVQNITFANGSATLGGAIYVDGNLEVENSTFTGNESDQDGGAIYVDDDTTSPSVVITGSTFTSNRTGPEIAELDGYSGGALYVEGGISELVAIDDSVFTDNEASELGGAVFAYGAIVQSSTFEQNTAPVGGALYAGLTVVYESTFAANEAVIGGAVEAVLYGATFGSTFVANSAETIGGAFASGADVDGPQLYGGFFSLNSTFVDNRAGDRGGAVFADYGQVGFTTFLDNTADTSSVNDFSQAMYVTGRSDTMGVGGSIFAGSGTKAQLGAPDIGIFDDRGGNVFSTSASTEISFDDPDESTLFSQTVTAIFGADSTLDDNGGSTETVALIGTSPAINAVPDGTFDFVNTTQFAAAADDLSSVSDFLAAVDDTDVDQRNVARTGLADAGAYEFGEPELGSELADTGSDATATSVLGGFAALLVGIGAAFAIGTRRLSRDGR